MLKEMRFVLIGLLFAIVTTLTISSMIAQSIVPLPDTSSMGFRAPVELLINGNLELDADNNKIPDGWTGVNTTIASSDKRKCDQIGSLVAHSAPCAFMFRGNPAGITSKIQQTITDVSAILNGSQVTFSVYLDARSGIPGTKIGMAKIIYSDGTSTKFTLNIPSARAVEDYIQISDLQIVNIPDGATVTKVKVDFRYNGKIGKFFIDDASLTVDSNMSTTPTTSVTATSTSVMTATATATPFQLIAADGVPNAFFGVAVDISGDTLVVGAVGDKIGTNSSQGSAYVFVRDGETWIQQQKLTASDGAVGDAFGASVAISGDTLVVGAPLDDINTNYNQGSAYVFVRNGTTWMEQQKLIADDGAGETVNEFGDRFGNSVAIIGDTVVIGATCANIEANWDQGAVYVFIRNGTIWGQQQKLTVNGSAYDRFGTSVASNGNTIFVNDTTTANPVYAFAYSTSLWSLQQTLDGDAMDVSGDTALVSGYEVGSVVYTRTAGVWTAQQQLIGAWEVIAISNYRASVGKYVFTQSGGTWGQMHQFIPDGLGTCCNAMAINDAGDTAVGGAAQDQIGANVRQGSAWVFDLGPLP